jgi:hypothetical protein
MRFILTCLTSLICIAASGQSISRQVISAFGISTTTANHYAAATVGEPVSGTYTTGFSAKSGFIQPENWTFVAVNEYEMPELLLYPNPVQSILHVQTKDLADVSIALFDITGKLILELTTHAGTESTIDLSALSDGIYLVRVSSEGRPVHESKVVKQS